jgi:hypothetical protein
VSEPFSIFITKLENFKEKQRFMKSQNFARMAVFWRLIDRFYPEHEVVLKLDVVFR